MFRSLILSLLLSSVAWSQVAVTSITVQDSRPVPAAAKVKYKWQATGDTVVKGRTNSATLKSASGTFTGTVFRVLVTGGEISIEEPVPFSFALGVSPTPDPTPEPVDPVDLRSLVTPSEGAQYCSMLRGVLGTFSEFRNVEEVRATFRELAKEVGLEFHKATGEISTRLSAAATLDVAKVVVEAAVKELGCNTSGPRQVVIFYESENNTPAFGSLKVSLRVGEAADYFRQHNHPAPLALDKDTPSIWKDRLGAKLQGASLPQIFVLDDADNSVLFQGPLSLNSKASEVIDILKNNGG